MITGATIGDLNTKYERIIQPLKSSTAHTRVMNELQRVLSLAGVHSAIK